MREGVFLKVGLVLKSTAGTYHHRVANRDFQYNSDVNDAYLFVFNLEVEMH